MSLEVKVRKQTLAFSDEKVEIYVAAADRNSTITTEKLAQQMSLLNGGNQYQIRLDLEVMVEAMVHFFEEGHPVRIDGLGSFLPSVKSASSTKASEVGVKKVRITFYPAKAFLERVSKITYVTTNELDKADDTQTSTGDSTTGTEEDPFG